MREKRYTVFAKDFETHDVFLVAQCYASQFGCATYTATRFNGKIEQATAGHGSHFELEPKTTNEKGTE